MCYKMALPKPEDFEYVCSKCGTKTVYPQNRRARRRFLRTLRDGVASLKAKGLNKAQTSDINLLSTFLDGNVILTGSRGAKSPLKNQLPRLRELLGGDGK